MSQKGLFISFLYINEYSLQVATATEEDYKKKEEEYNTPQTQFDRDIILYQIQTLDVKAEALENEVRIYCSIFSLSFLYRC